jgi:hypothetical protein
MAVSETVFTRLDLRRVITKYLENNPRNLLTNEVYVIEYTLKQTNGGFTNV